MKNLINRIKYTYSPSNIRYMLGVYPRATTLALIGDIIILALLVSVVTWVIL